MAAAFWLTGLSSAGKSSVAAQLRTLLLERGVRPVMLDGDRLRATLPWQPGYEPNERLELAGFYARLTRELVEQGHLVICATISLFHSTQAWNREHIPGYFEVWLRAPTAELHRRDHGRHVYSRGGRNVIGQDTVAEFPLAPDLVIDNYGTTTARSAALVIFEACGRDLVPQPCSVGRTHSTPSPQTESPTSDRSS